MSWTKFSRWGDGQWRGAKLDNPETQRRVLDLVKAGNYIETAASCAGVERTHFQTYVRTHEEFAMLLHAAVGEAEAANVSYIAAAREKKWEAAAWLLERRNPRKWGSRVTVAVQEELNDALDRLEAVLDRESYQRALEALSNSAALPAGNDGAAAESAAANGRERPPETS